MNKQEKIDQETRKKIRQKKRSVRQKRWSAICKEVFAEARRRWKPINFDKFGNEIVKGKLKDLDIDVTTCKQRKGKTKRYA